MGKQLRLDLKDFRRQRAAGALVVAAAVLAAVLTVSLLEEGRRVAGCYLGAGHEISCVTEFERVIRSAKPVAVMFMSPGCPLCERMYPHWAVLEARSDSLPVSFYHVVLGPETLELFQRYGVESTPTFIVFVGGRPVARHEGPFAAERGSVANVMLAWALAAASTGEPSSPRDYAEEGLEIYRARCAPCHGVLKGLDRRSVEEWLEGAERTAVDARALVACAALRGKVEKALSSGAYLHEVYPGGFDGLVSAVLSMRRYVPDLLYHEAQRTAYLLDYVTAVLEGREPPSFAWMNLTAAEALPSEEAAAAAGTPTPRHAGLGLVGVLAALAAGAASALSPCAFPLLLAHLSAAACSGRRVGLASCALCGAAAAAGVVAVGALVVAASSLALAVEKAVLAVASLALVAAGASSLLGVPSEVGGVTLAWRGGILGLCAAYGFLAVQCNLPLVVGGLLLLAGLGPTLWGAAALTSLAAGVGIPLAVLTWLASRGAAVVGRLAKRAELLGRAGGAVLLAAGTYLLLYSLELI